MMVKCGTLRRCDCWQRCMMSRSAALCCRLAGEVRSHMSHRRFTAFGGSALVGLADRFGGAMRGGTAEHHQVEAGLVPAVGGAGVHGDAGGFTTAIRPGPTASGCRVWAPQHLGPVVSWVHAHVVVHVGSPDRAPGHLTTANTFAVSEKCPAAFMQGFRRAMFQVQHDVVLLGPQRSSLISSVIERDPRRDGEGLGRRRVGNAP